jgi:hypothetical protein
VRLHDRAAKYAAGGLTVPPRGAIAKDVYGNGPYRTHPPGRVGSVRMARILSRSRPTRSARRSSRWRLPFLDPSRGRYFRAGVRGLAKLPEAQG